jgi:hypothetical protein
MANTIENSNLPAANFVDKQSRYISSAVLYYGDRRLLTFSTYKRSAITSTGQNQFYVITKGTEYRPDLVSLRAYGSVSLWWKIMEANKIYDIWDFKAGLNIIIPNSLL